MLGAQSFAHWREFLGAKLSRPIANNTRVERVLLRDGIGARLDRRTSESIGTAHAIAIRLHATDVIYITTSAGAGDVFELYTGGWHTVTTRRRLNEYAPAHVYQHDGVMMICAPGDWAHAIPFFEGVRVDADGVILNAPDAPDGTPARELRARINGYVRGFLGALRAGIDAPSGADCWYCAGALGGLGVPPVQTLAVDESGQLVDAPARADHLLEHIAESYYVPSLAWLAMRQTGRTDVGIAYALGALGDDRSRMQSDDKYHEVSRALRRYLVAILVDGRPMPADRRRRVAILARAR